MDYRVDAPLIVQGDRTVLLEVNNAFYEAARDHLARFAELEKSPEYIHTYRISSLSLWNAASAGMTADEILTGLRQYAKYPLPDNVVVEVKEAIGRYGRVRLTRDPDDPTRLRLMSDDPLLLMELERNRNVQPYIIGRVGPHTLQVPASRRGHVKQALVKAGYPAEDLVGYVAGGALHLQLRDVTASGQPFVIRHYQRDASDVFWADGSDAGGAGVIVLPCGAGKTIVGMLAMAQAQTNTLILTPSTVAARQWREELLDKTTVSPEMIGEYTGLRKEICPITVTTYQILTHRKRGTKGQHLPLEQEFPHFGLFNEGDWGLIIYDEVHLLPAPVFRITAELQARRRLGLTATLVREDGLEEDVFSLIGPKKYDVPWHDLERQGWIAPAICYEIRVGMPEAERLEYIVAEERQKYRIAADNSIKLDVLDRLLRYHRGDQILIIGMYLQQLEKIAKHYDFPLITGDTRVAEREALYAKFRTGEVKTLVVSKVANFSIDLPDASVAIQISGTFGSRQEEAQRLGRILRPKAGGRQAYFYSIVTKETVDQEYSANRQRFLTEQGYRYLILYDEEIPGALPHTQRR
ncbi:MAG TPA: DEAD/DEAH box helicase [Anaerolineae bacterium]|nr:DEAD/DEAH box helicase [Anaerolineae bacterium]HQK14501.1 DEAD/DEAH box helicase [Anaerolineae bacterium]